MELNMVIKGGKEQLVSNLINQLNNFWLDINTDIIYETIDDALLREEVVLSSLNKNNKYVWNDGVLVFTPVHSVQYSIFLYFLSNVLYKRYPSRSEADCVYYLNKIMNSVDWFYAIELPNVFYAEHPVGSVLGRASYGERIYIYQGCTIGGSRDALGNLHYPQIEGDLIMYANSSVLGNCRIGKGVVLGAGTRVVNQDVPAMSMVFGSSPNLYVKRLTIDDANTRIRLNWN